jgi:hypothetical protein
MATGTVRNAPVACFLEDGVQALVQGADFTQIRGAGI